MSNEIKTVEGTSSQFMQIIERVVKDPQLNIDMLEKMLNMQERILNRKAKEDFAISLSRMQNELPQIYKEARTHNASYAKLETINQQILPVLQKFGFAIMFDIAQEDKVVSVTAKLKHIGGHEEQTSIRLPLDISGQKSAVQSVGSTVTYGKRYTLCALLNISTSDDNDGNAEAQVDITDLLLAIEEAASMDELRVLYHSGFTKHKGNLTRAQLISAKDKRKRELNNENV